MTSGKGVDDRINTLIKKKEEELFNYGQDIVTAFSPPVVGCLVKNGLKRGGQGNPWTPLVRLWFYLVWKLLALVQPHYCLCQIESPLNHWM